MPELSANAKVLWAEIDSLYSEEKGGCYASNKYLMNFLGLSRAGLHAVLRELKKQGLIVNVNDNGGNEFNNRGRNRVIKSIHPSAEKLVEKQANLLKNEKSTVSKTRSPIYKDYNKEEGGEKSKSNPRNFFTQFFHFFCQN
ncbi:MAG: helix-turn-helix domain-containing protein [Candidatus Rhabdochlamydia sp.]|jgi:biotin operon repressor|nr:hypothetical protein [Patescibacteria group bacterium]